MAFDFTCLATTKAKAMSASSRSVGLRLVTTVSFSAETRPLSRSCTRKPPATQRTVNPGAAASGRPPAVRRRRFFFALRILRASASASGAMMTSVKIFAISSAAAPSSVRLTAMMPPKALTESQASALR